MAHDDETTTARSQDPCVDAAARPDDAAATPCAAQELLAEHVPLALIVDLVAPAASSEEILRTEGLPDDPWWEAPEGKSDGSCEGDSEAPVEAQSEDRRDRGPANPDAPATRG